MAQHRPRQVPAPSAPPAASGASSASGAPVSSASSSSAAAWPHSSVVPAEEALLSAVSAEAQPQIAQQVPIVSEITDRESHTGQPGQPHAPSHLPTRHHLHHSRGHSQHHPHHQIFATPAAASAFRSLSHASCFDDEEEEADDERSAAPSPTSFTSAGQSRPPPREQQQLHQPLRSRPSAALLLSSSSSSSDSDYLHPAARRLAGRSSGHLAIHPANIPSTIPGPAAHPHSPYHDDVDNDNNMGPQDGQNGFGGEGDDDDHPMQATHSRLEAAEVPAYPGEDTRPTSPREILGWYMYAFAAETYVICAIASFIPILLESLARENGVLLSDRTTPCTASNAHSLSRSASSSAKSSQCIVYVLGIEVNTASFAMYTFSISVLLQALLVVSISCAADHGHYRKKLLLAFAWTGSFSVMLYLFVTARVYLFGGLLAIISNTSFGASFVLLNSFLPLLVRHHPSVMYGHAEPVAPEAVEHSSEDNDGDNNDSGDRADTGELDDSTTALLRGHRDDQGLASPSDPPLSPTPRPRRSHEEQTSLELSLSTQISSKGIGIGYCAGLFVQCMAILIVFRMHNSIWSQRVVLFGIGAWWAIFTIPAAMWLRPRPGPPLPAAAGLSSSSRSSIFGQARAWLAYFAYAWKSLFRTISYARRLVDIVLFLAGWFLLSDAIATTSSTAILFAKTQLHMEVWALGMISVISTLTGVIGAFSWAYISRRLGLKPLHTILACLALFELIPIYGLLGYLPFVRSWGVFGLQQPWEMYPLAAVYGLVLGGLSSYCRSLYGELVPPGSEAAFYALYAITDKGSSVFGPAIVGAIIDASGEIRPAFWFLAVVVGLPAVLLYFVDVERGKREGELLATVIEGFRPGSGEGGNGGSNDSNIESNGQGIEDTDSSHTPQAILADYSDEDEPMPQQTH